AENLVATRIPTTSLLVPQGKKNYAVTAMNRYGLESTAKQLLLNAGPVYAAPIIARSNGSAIALPPKGSVLDAEIVVIEDMKGQQVAVRPYTKLLYISNLPDGLYQLRSLGRKGRSHRIGFFAKKSSEILNKTKK
ncbi:MAG: hypothetical protein ACSW8D_17215, partial [Prevotella sp.]